MDASLEADGRMRLALDNMRESYPHRSDVVRNILISSGFTSEQASEARSFTVLKPRDVPETYPTFGATLRPLSPLLQARYRLAGTIKDLAWSFPSARQAERLHRSKAIRAAYASHRDSWDESAPMRLLADQLSIFGVLDAEDCNVAYLDWSAGIEPKVWAYTDASEHQYVDIAEFITTLGTV
jgi:hypothetical protein